MNLRTYTFSLAIIFALAGIACYGVGYYGQFAAFKAMAAAFGTCAVALYATICIADRKRLTADKILDDGELHGWLNTFFHRTYTKQSSVAISEAIRHVTRRLDELLCNRPEKGE